VSPIQVVWGKANISQVDTVSPIRLVAMRIIAVVYPSMCVMVACLVGFLMYFSNMCVEETATSLAWALIVPG
jgi:hypothetical protein